VAGEGKPNAKGLAKGWANPCAKGKPKPPGMDMPPMGGVPGACGRNGAIIIAPWPIACSSRAMASAISGSVETAAHWSCQRSR